MSDVVIRRMLADDAVAVSELARQLGYLRSPNDVRRWIAETGQSQLALVAEHHGRVVGWIQAHDLALLIHHRVLEIGGLVVGDGQRGRGIGRQLVTAVAAWGRDRGHTEIWVRSNVVRERAHSFYEDLGFAQIKTSYTFRLELDDSGSGQ